MRVVYVEPHKAPYIADVAHTLEAEQKAVGDGLIEPIDNYDGTCLVGNEESKLRGMDGNRRIGDGSSIMAGPFFVCGDSGESFRSLTDEEVTRYMARFAEPEDISPEEVEADMGFMPQTGDNSNLGVWIGLGGIALGGAIACVIMYFKKKDDGEK